MCFVVILSVSFSFVEMVPFTANNSDNIESDHLIFTFFHAISTLQWK